MAANLLSLRYLKTKYISFAKKKFSMESLKLDQEKLEMAAGKLRAISHPARIAIIDMLQQESLCVTQIYERLDIDQASASHHLSILKNKGILMSDRRGKKIYYSLKLQTLTEIIDCINRCHE